MFPDNKNGTSLGHFCILDTTLHPVSKIQECSYFLFEGNKEKISKYFPISILNETKDQAISIVKSFWTITTVSPRNYTSFDLFLSPHSVTFF